MKLKCHISGYSWQSSDNAFTNLKANCIHPVITLPYTSLERLAKLWQYRKLSEEESKLLCIALLYACPLVSFKNSLVWESLQSHKIAVWLPELLELNETISNLGKHTEVRTILPRLVISTENANTSNLDLSAFGNACNETLVHHYYTSTYVKLLEAREELKRDSLKRALMNKTRNPTRYIRHLSSWLADAALFPTDKSFNFEGKVITLSEYWIYCFNACGTRDKSFRYLSIDRIDLEDLLDWIDDNLPMTTIYSFQARKIIADTLEDHSFFSSSSYETIQDQPLPADTIILTKPDRSSYSDIKSFMLANSAYIVQQAALKRDKERAALKTLSALESLRLNTKVNL